MRRDGTIDIAEHRQLPGIDKRATIDKRESSAESILEGIALNQVGSREFETTDVSKPGPDQQLATSLDDQLTELAELVMSTQRS